MLTIFAISVARVALSLGLLLVVTVVSDRHASAFEEPVHLSMTIWLAISAGFLEDDAFQLGRFDQGTDDDPLTSPIWPLNVEQRRLYHAFGGAPAVRELEDKAVCTRDAITEAQFQRIGQFLHALEDQYSHRCCGPVFGQLTVGAGPDKPWYAPLAFVRMVEHKFDKLLEWRRKCRSGQFSEQLAQTNFARSKALLEAWARDAYDFSAEDENNEARWSRLISSLYGANYLKYTDTYVKAYRQSRQTSPTPSPAPPVPPTTASPTPPTAPAPTAPPPTAPPAPAPATPGSTTTPGGSPKPPERLRAQ